MKIKFFSDYDRSVNLLSRFIANYDVFDDELTFTTGSDYDFAVVFNKTNEPLKHGSKIITVMQEPTWSDVNRSNPFLTYSNYIIIHDRALFENTFRIRLSGQVIEEPSYMFYHDHIEKSFFNDTETITKKKKLSIIVSSLSFETGNYGLRLRLLRKILTSDLDIDIYGRGLTIQDDRYKGEIKFKHTGLIPYEYSIALENCNEKNYVTEKFFDCSLCNTIPIYNGAPNIDEVYNEKYFKTINVNSPDIIDEIKDIIKYAPPVAGPDNNKKRYFNRFNLYIRLKDIILND
ncbi:glycosyltransferase family 10 domain-containing protein [Mucilaginibacter sp. UR6-11]|uniref:glycosyltransferase family 10 domain-containing protein n=1 Tax=Mucilaginibacter sp. UR6-11 TaxID=1435644 RepID=UPI001E3237DC|nr:glycosyltransferase family 10 [Mucilaginibacter sp. UR6-11]MCC8423666.1 glycosyltransferase family 10 [Mucilaginibacter sp. UR6-11]